MISPRISCTTASLIALGRRLYGHVVFGGWVPVLFCQVRNSKLSGTLRSRLLQPWPWRRAFLFLHLVRDEVVEVRGLKVPARIQHVASGHGVGA